VQHNLISDEPCHRQAQQVPPLATNEAPVTTPWAWIDGLPPSSDRAGHRRHLDVLERLRVEFLAAKS